MTGAQKTPTSERGLTHQLGRLEKTHTLYTFSYDTAIMVTGHQRSSDMARGHVAAAAGAALMMFALAALACVSWPAAPSSSALYEPTFEPPPPPPTYETREIPKDTRLRDTAFHMFTDPHHLRVSSSEHVSDDALLASLTPEQVRKYDPPPALSHARAPRDEIPSDRSLRQKAFSFLTSRTSKSSAPAAAGGATDSAESAADFIMGQSAPPPPPPPPRDTMHVPLFKNVDRGVYNVAAKAAADVDDFIEGREKKDVGAKVYREQGQHSSALVNSPSVGAQNPDALPVAPWDTSASVNRPSPPPRLPPAAAASSHASSATTSPGLDSRQGGVGGGGLPSYVPAPSMQGGVAGVGVGGHGLGVPEDNMATAFMEADKVGLVFVFN
jgi:hypothetical protein